MKINLALRSYEGKWCVALIISFFVFFGLFILFVSLRERGGETYFSNLKLALPFTMAWICGVGSFCMGVISVIKKQERSILFFCQQQLVFLS